MVARDILSTDVTIFSAKFGGKSYPLSGKLVSIGVMVLRDVVVSRHVVASREQRPPNLSRRKPAKFKHGSVTACINVQRPGCLRSSFAGHRKGPGFLKSVGGKKETRRKTRE